MPNRLANEQSPYLLQHKDNPVDWYPWGDAAFAHARRENKLIFLSVGYATCHWCHVMEHESFEDAGIADVLNQHYVSIKVDREERPDVDRVYMTFVQATTGSGGWPMNVWLTPSLEPFYGGTYYPPTARWGRPGFTEILQEVARVWREEPDKVVQSATSIIERLRSLGERGGNPVLPGTGVLEVAVQEFGSAFDPARGGFGDAPKFPRPSELLFLLREHARTGVDAPRDMALGTLRAMAGGGMRDHIGGGFHRYSVDGEWRVPHFEKMLYDQAQLALAYTEAAQLTDDPFFGAVAMDTLDYVARDLTHPEGGFYSAEDADSVAPELASQPSPPKSEGAFYIWRDEEIATVTGDDAEVVRLRYGILPDGNVTADPQNEFSHQNILYAAGSSEEIAAATGRTVDDTGAVLLRARAALLTAWNGLMIAAYARAGRVLDGRAADVDMARRAATFVRGHLWNADEGTLLRRYRRGVAGVDAYAEDYAYLICGLLELFQADGDAGWLEWATALQGRLDAMFWDPVDGGWFSTTGKDASVLLRLKDEYDGAEPAATSVAVLNLLVLSHLTGDAAMADRVTTTFGTLGARASMSGRSVPMMLAALSTYHAGVPQIVIAGEPDAADTRALSEVVRRHYIPTAVVVPVSEAQHAPLSRLLPWTRSLRQREGRATAFVCRDFACQTPTTSVDELDAQLEGITHT